VCEYGLAVALVMSSAHVTDGGLLVAGGAAFGLLALTGHGPTGVVRVCPPKVHAVLDVVVALCLALAPIIPALRPDATGILIAEFAAVGWLRLTTLTSFTRPVRAAAATAPPPSAQAAIDAGARRLGKEAGRARRAWRRHG
jgi:hypothetical protein